MLSGDRPGMNNKIPIQSTTFRGVSYCKHAGRDKEGLKTGMSARSLPPRR